MTAYVSQTQDVTTRPHANPQCDLIELHQVLVELSNVFMRHLMCLVTLLSVLPHRHYSNCLITLTLLLVMPQLVSFGA